jgi:glycosyltransferase involved in cell wall biosynthesis
MARYRLAYLVSHPIQYQAPLLARIAAEPEIDLTVFFCSDISVRPFVDRGFGREIAWDTPLTEGYAHEFLPALGDKRRLSAFRPLTYGLARRLRQSQFDALWVHGYARLANLVAMVNAKRLGLKVLLRDEPWAQSRARGAAKGAAKAAFFATLRPLVDAVLAIGSKNRDYMIAQGFAAERVFLVPYAIDNALFRRRAEEASRTREALRAELGLRPGRPVILFASKLQDRKRPDDLLAAYARLVAAGASPPPYLLFVGDGERGAALSAVAQGALDGVRFLGFRNQSELPRFYDLCDVFVLPSRHEPWGLVVNEAMNAGRAIVASDEVGAAHDLVRNGENGFIFPAGDVGALADALARVLDDPASCRRMGARSLEAISRWGFDEDLIGLKAALDAVIR